MKKILVINGANLCMLGKREPQIYGTQTLEQINAKVSALAAELKVKVEFFTSNSEGDIIDRIHAAGDCDGIIINAGAHTHYSHAIADALSCVECKKVEVHISNVHKREEFRHTSVISSSVTGVICGLGDSVYLLALRYLAEQE